MNRSVQPWLLNRRAVSGWTRGHALNRPTSLSESRQSSWPRLQTDVTSLGIAFRHVCVSDKSLCVESEEFLAPAPSACVEAEHHLSAEACEALLPSTP